MTTVQVPRFMRIREINKEFGIGLNTIYDAVRTEDLPAYHPNGRDLMIKADDVVKWIERHPYHSRITSKGKDSIA